MIAPSPEVLRQERQTRRAEANQRILRRALWFVLFFAALVTAIALAPDLSAWAEGLTIHPDCRNDPAC